MHSGWLQVAQMVLAYSDSMLTLSMQPTYRIKYSESIQQLFIGFMTDMCWTASYKPKLLHHTGT